MSTFNESYALFPSADSKSRVILANVYLTLESVSYKFVDAEFYISIFGVFLTIFHLIVLSRKSMRTSSIMSIMICTAICDLISMVESLGTRDLIMHFVPRECSPPLSLFTFHLFAVLQAIRDDVIRCSTWLSVLMALIRYIVLKLVRKASRVSSFQFGFQVFGASFSVSSTLSLVYFFRVNIIKIGEWVPGTSCREIPPTFPQSIYGTVASDLFKVHNQLVLRVFMFINGTSSKILPCILLPILTTLLILELRRTRNNRKGSMVSDKKNCDRTTGLVIFMTITSFIALLPTGTMTSLKAMYTDVGFIYMGTCVELICYCLLTLNSSLHFFICLAMSSQYRRTVKNLLKFKQETRIVKTG